MKNLKYISIFTIFLLNNYFSNNNIALNDIKFINKSGDLYDLVIELKTNEGEIVRTGKFEIMDANKNSLAIQELDQQGQAKFFGLKKSDKYNLKYYFAKAFTSFKTKLNSTEDIVFEKLVISKFAIEGLPDNENVTQNRKPIFEGNSTQGDKTSIIKPTINPTNSSQISPNNSINTTTKKQDNNINKGNNEETYNLSIFMITDKGNKIDNGMVEIENKQKKVIDSKNVSENGVVIFNDLNKNETYKIKYKYQDSFVSKIITPKTDDKVKETFKISEMVFGFDNIKDKEKNVNEKNTTSNINVNSSWTEPNNTSSTPKNDSYESSKNDYSDYKVVESDNGNKNVRNIHFVENSYVIHSFSKERIDKLINFLRGKDLHKIELYSYLDKDSSEENNSALAQKRAEACKEYLITSGNIAANKIILMPMGTKNQLVDCINCKEKIKNRRIEFKIIYR